MSTRGVLLWLALYRRRRMLIALALGLVLFELLIVMVVRAIPPTQLFDVKKLPEAFQAFAGSSGGGVLLASMPGLLGAALVHPFWMAMQFTAVASLAAAVLAADIEGGTIELVAARHVSRRQIVVERVAALVIATAVLNTITIAVLFLGFPLVDKFNEQIEPLGLVYAGVLGIALCLAVAGPAIVVSVRGRTKAQVISTAIAWGAGGFALNFLAQAWKPARPLRWLSPFFYYSPADGLVSGTMPWAHLGVLLGVFAVSLVVALVMIERRDLI